MNKNKYIFYVVLLLALVVVLVLLIKHKSPTAQAPAAPAASAPSVLLPPVPQLTVTQSGQGQLPANLPPKLPVEKNVQILQNETVLNSITGKHDAQYIYVTKLTLAQNLAAFQKYLAANKWKTASTVTQPDFDAINASQASTTLSVILDYKSAAPQGQVSLSYIY